MQLIATLFVGIVVIMDIQRLRNITTGKVHTTMFDIYEDLEYLSGESGLMTHQLTNIRNALLPYLRENITDSRFWDGSYDTTHIGELNLKPMDYSDKRAMWLRYCSMTNDNCTTVVDAY